MSTVVIYKSSRLLITQQEAWELLLRPGTLRKIGEGFVNYYGDLPSTWEVNQLIDIKPKFIKQPWSLLPTGSHIVKVKTVDKSRLLIETEESGGLVKKWNHVMHIIPSPNNECCLYSDTITIDAGWFTPIVEKLARTLYNHRHEQWLHLISCMTV